jgi:lysophospholipase L1-like esterase
LNLSLRGTLRLYNNNKFGKVNIPALQDEIRAGRRTPITIDQELVEAFRETVRFVRDNKAQLVLLYIPTVDLVNDIDKIRHEQVVNIFKKYAAQDVGIVFLDYNPTFSNRYEFFGDPTHLNKEGQQAITNRALIDLKPLLFKANQE